MFYILASDATVVVYTLIMLLVVAGLSVLLFFRVRKNYIREKEQKEALIAGTLTWPEMSTLIANYLTTLENPRYSLLFVDIDKYSHFTTVFGRKEGLGLVRTVATKIIDAIPKKAYIAKFKEDQFVIFFPMEFVSDDVYEYGKIILETFRKGLTTFNNIEIDLTASIAMAVYPYHGKTLDLMMDSLKLASLQLKRSGGDDIVMYSGRLIETVKDVEYSNELTKAIERKEFRLFYKPVYNLEDNTVVAYESFTRWEHPEHGLIEPQKFINIMEQTGDILWIGQWGIESLVGKYMQLKQELETVPLLSFKLSPKQLINEKLPTLINRVVRRYNVPASQFILEIGEFALFEKDSHVYKNIAALKKMGFKIAITEFTTEPKNFHILESLDIDYVVLDFNLFTEIALASEGYFKKLVDYVTETNKRVICSNVDTQEQVDYIISENVKFVVGDYYHEAITGKAVLEFPLKREGEPTYIPVEKDEVEEVVEVTEEVVEPTEGEEV